MDIIQMLIFIILLVAVTIPLGSYMAKVFTGEKTFFDPVAKPVEKFIYRIIGVDEKSEMDWKEYAAAVILFNLFGFLLLYFVQRWQLFFPFNYFLIFSFFLALPFILYPKNYK